MIESRKFYRCSDYHLLVYPTLEDAIRLSQTELGNVEVPGFVSSIYHDHVHPNRAAKWTKEWSEIQHCNLKCSMPEDIFLVIEIYKQNDYLFPLCLFPNFSGWVRWKSWYGAEEIKV